MYKEMYKGIMELFREDEDYDRKTMGRIPHYMSIMYDFDPLDIIKTVNIRTDKNMSDIVLVLASTPNHDERVRYSDMIYIDGELKKVVLFNLDAYMSQDIHVKLESICWSCWEVAITPAEQLKDLLDPDFHKFVSISNLIYYAPYIIITKVFKSKLFESDSIKISLYAAMLSILYKRDIYDTSVNSLIKLLNEVNLEDLLDNSLWLSVTNKVYPGIRFDEIVQNKDEDGEDDDEDEQI